MLQPSESQLRTGVYLFCFAGPGALGAPIEGTGIDGRSPLELRRMGDVVAVVSETSLEDLMGPEAEARMRSVEWLGPRALLHEQVVERVAAFSPVLPVRLGPLFSSEVTLARLVARNHETIVAFLDRVAGQEEWAVRGYVERERAIDARVKAAMVSSPPALSASPGLRYMQEKRMVAQAEAGLQTWLQETADRLWRELEAVSTSAVERNILPANGDQPFGEMIFNWAVLVPAADVPRLHTLIARFDEELGTAGVTLRESGAWPPYSFAPPLGEP